MKRFLLKNDTIDNVSARLTVTPSDELGNLGHTAATIIEENKLTTCLAPTVITLPEPTKYRSDCFELSDDGLYAVEINGVVQPYAFTPTDLLDAFNGMHESNIMFRECEDGSGSGSGGSSDGGVPTRPVVYISAEDGNGYNALRLLHGQQYKLKFSCFNGSVGFTYNGERHVIHDGDILRFDFNPDENLETSPLLVNTIWTPVWFEGNPDSVIDFDINNDVFWLVYPPDLADANTFYLDELPDGSSFTTPICRYEYLRNFSNTPINTITDIRKQQLDKRVPIGLTLWGVPDHTTIILINNSTGEQRTIGDDLVNSSNLEIYLRFQVSVDTQLSDIEFELQRPIDGVLTTYWRLIY